MIWRAISYQGDRLMQFIERITRFLQVPEDYEEEYPLLMKRFYVRYTLAISVRQGKTQV